MHFIINSPQNQILFNIFGLDLRYYGLILCSAIFIGIVVGYRLFKKNISKDEADFFLDYIPFVVFFSILGARLFYVIGNIEFYLAHKKEIFLINHGGLSIWGAILFGLVGLIFYLKLNKKNIYAHLDIIAAVMPLCQAIGRFGNYFNQEAFGKPSESFFKLYVDTQFRPAEYINYEYFHPTFLYESILDIISFLILILLFTKRRNLKSGAIFYLYIIFYSIIRLIVESIRIDSVSYVFNIPIASFISLIALLTSLILFKKTL